MQSDISLFNDTREDNDYEAVWEVGTAVTAEGWNAEFRIPFSQIRFTMTEGERSVWGFQVRRDMRVDRRMGPVECRAARHAGHRLALRPPHLRRSPVAAATRRAAAVQPREAANTRPTADPTVGFDGGLDLRVGLGTSATLSATINPDFGQVELDPAVLNLSVFETFFPEKRPFFLEDSRVFVLPFGQFPMFHSRRIGQAPGRSSSPTTRSSSASPIRRRFSARRSSPAKRRAGPTAASRR